MGTGAQFETIDNPASLAGRWRDLESRAESSFFTSWHWMGPWLATLRQKPMLFSWRTGGRDLALALVSLRRIRRRLLPVPTLFLNQTGDPAEDKAYIEYNTLLAEAGRESEAFVAFHKVLTSAGDADSGMSHWHRLRLAGLPGADVARVQALNWRIVEKTESLVPYVDLAKVREHEGRYRDLLSRNTRQSIARSERLYKDAGPLELAAAGNAEQALSWLDHHARLQIARLQAKGRTSSFETPLFRTFVAALLRANIPTGTAEMLRLSAGAPIGYLINFKYRRQVMNSEAAMT